MLLFSTFRNYVYSSTDFVQIIALFLCFKTLQISPHVLLHDFLQCLTRSSTMAIDPDTLLSKRRALFLLIWIWIQTLTMVEATMDERRILQ